MKFVWKSGHELQLPKTTVWMVEETFKHVTISVTVVHALMSGDHGIHYNFAYEVLQPEDFLDLPVFNDE